MRVLLLSLYDEWCLGLRTLSAVLKRDGHDVRLAYLHDLPRMASAPTAAACAQTAAGAVGKEDPEGYHVPPASVPAEDFRALERLVREVNPGLIGVGFSSNFAGLAERATEVMRRASGAPIVWGGVDATANPDLAITFADIVCLGEGEGPLSELAACLAAGKDYSAIPNLWVRREGQVVRNPVRPLIQDLDAVPWADFDPGGKYWISGGEARAGTIPDGSNLHRSFPIMASRGCLYACAYCCNSMYRVLYGAKGYARLRSPQNVVGEICQYIQTHPQTEVVEFLDDVFGWRAEWVEEFAALYAERVGKPFWCFTYPALCKPPLVAALQRAGVAFIVLGLQSGSPRTLTEDYGRYGSLEKTVQAARTIHEAGIPLVVDLILGNPFDTEADHRATLEMMLALPPGFILQEINHLTLYRNYPLTQKARDQGLVGPWFPGRNAVQSPATPEDDFWRAILTLTQFPQIAADSLRTLSRDPYLHEHPEAIRAVAMAFVDQTYLPGTRIRRVASLEKETAQLRDELARYRGSRAVRAYFRLKKTLGLGS